MLTDKDETGEAMDETKAGLLADLRAKRDRYCDTNGKYDLAYALMALDAFLDAPAPSQPTPEARVDELAEAAAIARDRDVKRAVAFLLARNIELPHVPWSSREDERSGAAYDLAGTHEDDARYIYPLRSQLWSAVLDAALARRSAPTPGYREAWEAGREAAALLFVEDAERFRAEADRALAMDLTVLAKMHMGDAAECLREAGRIRALPLPESALLTKAAPREAHEQVRAALRAAGRLPEEK
jgi:hypothetical protein